MSSSSSSSHFVFDVMQYMPLKNPQKALSSIDEGEVKKTAKKVSELAIFAKGLFLMGSFALLTIAPIAFSLGASTLIISNALVCGLTLIAASVAALVFSFFEETPYLEEEPMFFQNKEEAQNHEKIKEAEATLASFDKWEALEKLNFNTTELTLKPLANNSNNCWVNSLIQVIFHSPLLFESLTSSEKWQALNSELKQLQENYVKLQNDSKKKLQKEEAEEKKAAIDKAKIDIDLVVSKKRVLAAFNLFAKRYKDWIPGELINPLDTQLIRCALQGLEPRIELNSQEDPLEALSLLRTHRLLDSIEMQIEEKSINIDTQVEKIEKKNTEEFAINLSMQEKKTLKELLETFCNEEIPENEGFFGDSNEFKLTKQIRRFIQWPQELFLTLKRFKFIPPIEAKETVQTKQDKQEHLKTESDQLIDQKVQEHVKAENSNPQRGKVKKITDEIHVPLAMDLEDSLFFHDNDDTIRYHLSSFIRHIGGENSTNSGHYVAYIRKGEKWFLCNDSAIEEVDNKENPNAITHAAGIGYGFQYVKENS